MLKLLTSKYLKIFYTLLLLLFIAKSISLFFLFILPKNSIELNFVNNYQPKYQKVDFKNMFLDEDTEYEFQNLKSVKNIQSIEKILLKGLYATKDFGFVIVALKSSPKNTKIIEIGENFAGYKLIQIANTNAVFEKNSKKYVVLLDLGNKKINDMVKAIENKDKVNDNDEMVFEKTLSRQEISFYAKNPKQIWKEISIIEVKENGKLKGFKVARIDPNSKIATLGLKKGDLIIKANNVVLKSYRDALNIYTNIDTIDLIQIVVIRDGVQKELVYEIN